MSRTLDRVVLNPSCAINVRDINCPHKYLIVNKVDGTVYFRTDTQRANSTSYDIYFQYGSHPIVWKVV